MVPRDLDRETRRDLHGECIRGPVVDEGITLNEGSFLFFERLVRGPGRKPVPSVTPRLLFTERVPSRTTGLLEPGLGTRVTGVIEKGDERGGPTRGELSTDNRHGYQRGFEFQVEKEV